MSDTLPRPAVDLNKPAAPAAEADTIPQGVPLAEADTLPQGLPLAGTLPENLADTLPEDPDGDRPFIPAWVRSRAHRRAARRRAARRARRAVRRWAGRQRTTRGHAAQLARGLRRTHEWVVGFHGIHVQAAAHHAHAATREAREAARRARFTLIPKQRQAAMMHAERAQTVAVSAVVAHKRARAEVRRGRAWRSAVAYGAPLAATLTGAAEVGWLGTVCGMCTTAAAFAFLGRRPLTETAWDPERRSLGDGDPLTETMLDRAFVAAQIIREGQQLRMVAPCMVDGENADAWQAVFDLPEGVTVERAKARAPELAAALGIDRSQLDLRQAGGEGRLALWASVVDPFAITRRSPLIGRTEPINTWRDGIPLAFDKRGRIIYVTVSDYSLLFGGAARSGKGMGLANVLAGVMLDPRVRTRLFDGKGSGEYVPFAPVLATFVRRNPARLRDFLYVMVAEMHRRTEILVERGVSKASEQLLEELGGIELVIVDELATYTAKEGLSGDYADEITELLAQLGAVGPATGIILALATQYPQTDIVPSRLRGNLSGRMAMRTDTPAASNTILGDGMVGQGYDASKIPNVKTSRGRAWLTTPDTGVIEVRSLFIDEATGEIRPLIATGIELRAAAGTLPGHCPDPVETELRRITGASSVAGGRGGNGGIVRTTILDDLTRAAESTGYLTNTAALMVLAATDPKQYGRAEGESESAWSSRAGKALKAQLASLGTELEPTRLTLPDGSRPNGYPLAALQSAAEKARNTPATP